MTGGRRQRRLSFAVLALTVSSLWRFALPPAHAVGRLQTGTWWRNQTGTASVPPPPHLPAGGLWISSDPTGPSAVSAIRFTLRPSERAPSLTLHVAKLTAPPGTEITSATVPIRACAVTGSWAAPTIFPGRWSTRPTYDCANGALEGQFSSDLATVVFDLTVLAEATTYDLALVPGTEASSGGLPTVSTPPVPGGADAGPSPTFDVTFKPVGLADVSVSNSVEPTTEPSAGVISPPDTTTVPAPEGLPLSPVTQQAVGPAPLSASTPTAPIADAVPAPARLRGSRSTGTSKTTREITAVVFCALAAWAWRLLAGDTYVGQGEAAGAQTIYDLMPVGTEQRVPRRFTNSSRDGPPPALR